MVSASVCLAKTDKEVPQRDVELADVVGRFGLEYRS